MAHKLFLTQEGTSHNWTSITIPFFVYLLISLQNSHQNLKTVQLYNIEFRNLSNGLRI